MRPTPTKAEARLASAFMEVGRIAPDEEMASAYMGVGRIAPDEERLVLLKPVVQFYFIYGVSRGYLCIYLYFKH